MANPDIAAFVRKRKIPIVIFLVFVAYLGVGVVFREYRMDPDNRYYSNHLPSAPRPSANAIAANEDEAVEALVGDLFKEPTLMERLFAPAEKVFRLVGY